MVRAMQRVVFNLVGLTILFGGASAHGAMIFSASPASELLLHSCAEVSAISHSDTNTSAGQQPPNGPHNQPNGPDNEGEGDRLKTRPVSTSTQARSSSSGAGGGVSGVWDLRSEFTADDPLNSKLRVDQDPEISNPDPDGVFHPPCACEEAMVSRH